MTERVICNGLDGADPLGMLATLGTLVIGARASIVRSVAWAQCGGWRPEFNVSGGEGALVDAVVEALVGHEAALASERVEVMRVQSEHAERAVADAARHLEAASSAPERREAKRAQKSATDNFKAATNALRAAEEAAERLAGVGAEMRHPITTHALHLDDVSKGGLCREQLRDIAGAPNAAPYLVGIGADLHLGTVKQTLARTHFSFANNNSGKQLLKDFAGLTRRVTPSRVRDALFGPGSLRDPITGLGWEPGSQRSYALQFNDPQGDVTCQVARHALAFFGLAMLPVVPYGRDRATVGFSRIAAKVRATVDDDADGDTSPRRARASECWTWPLWEPPLSEPDVRVLLGWRELGEEVPSGAECRARRILSVYRARRIVLDKRSYFSPARAVS